MFFVDRDNQPFTSVIRWRHAVVALYEWTGSWANETARPYGPEMITIRDMHLILRLPLHSAKIFPSGLS